ncbi:MAG: DNA alkylation repair protein [Muribaculaceae bacterium]|nr:DNA alkylation repair protein [Muribaculaceae bacterium]
MVDNWTRQLNERAKPEKISDLMRFFKCGPGEYAEGDIFIGLTVPDNRAVSRTFFDAPIEIIDSMIDNPVHEYRLAGLLALVERYRKTKDPVGRNEIARHYIEICHKANNWDLVDLSTEYILGHEIVAGRCLDDIERLSNSDNLWEQRVAIIATLTPIRQGELDLAFELCHRYISRPHPLLRKAVGWILRECGKKDRGRLEEFLAEHISEISATSLSYATEHFTPEARLKWRTLRKNH